MSRTCIKNGVEVEIIEYDAYYRGDYYRVGDTHVFKLNKQAQYTLPDKVDFDVYLGFDTILWEDQYWVYLIAPNNLVTIRNEELRNAS